MATPLEANDNFKPFEPNKMTQDKFERELSHRERAMIFRSSSIFDGQGMSDSTCYDPLRQREILRGEKQKADMKFQPQLGN